VVVTHQEKRAWIMLVVTVIAYGWYALTIASRAGGGGLTQVSYPGVLLASVGGAIAASIVAEIGLGVVTPSASRERDVRDRQIGRLGEYIGQSFVIAGAVAAMLMAMAGWDRFWIANVIYLGFVLSAVLGSIAKLAMYRGSFPQW
jgi:membrane glycosyltransferase